jgi:HEAT repeat protein
VIAPDPRRRWRLAPLGLAAAVFSLGLALDRADAARAAEPRPDVTVREGRLTVDVQDAPLAEVLRAIGEKSRVRVTVGDDVDARITAALAGVPLDEGIRRLARGHSLVAVYRAPGDDPGAAELTEVRVYAPFPGAAPSPGQLGAASRLEAPGAASRSAAGAGAAGVPSVPLRIQGVRRFAMMRSEAVVPPLAQALTADRDPQVRAEAAIALATVGGEAALSALLEAAADENMAVRLRVADALGQFQDDRARATLDQMSRGDGEPQVRRRAASILAAWRRTGQTPPLAGAEAAPGR